MRKVFIVMALLPLLALSLSAQVTGKISGRVIDSQTGEPLPGANVLILGTTMGAASDPEGYYFIINVPVGEWTVRTTMMGYEPLTVENARVSAGLTTTLNFELRPTVIEVEGVTVTAERPLVIPDATSTTHIVTSEQIERQPVTAFTQAVSQQAGVVTSTGGTSWVTDGLHIRGGRGDEVVFMVDGMSAQDRLTGRSDASIDINISAVEEVSVITGGFNAEYGQAMSGVVNVITKEGRTPEGMFRYSTDRISKDPREQNVFEASLGGPLRFYPKFLYFFSGEVSSRDHTQSWYGPMSHTDREFYSLQGKLTYKITPAMKLNLSGFLSRTQWGRFGMYVGYADMDSWCSNSLKYAPPEYRSDGFRKAYQVTTALSHQVSRNTFYELRFGRFNAHRIDGHRDWDYEADRNLWEDFKFVPWWKDIDVGRGTIDDPGWDAKDENGEYYYPYGVPIELGFRLGSPCGWLERVSAYDGIKFDLTSQITRNHQVKMGVDGKIHRAKRENAQYIDRTLKVPVITDGDIIGHEVPPEYREKRYALYSDEYDYNPEEIAIYLQDKIEYPGFIVNTGLRFDYFDPACWKYRDIASPYTEEGELDTVTAKVKYQVSPRFGISFPVTERTVFHLSYGHFFQVSQFRWLYDGHNIDLYTYPGGWPIVSNPDLEPQKTISYEIGLVHELTPGLALNVTGFYKDIYHLIGTRYIESIPRRYTMYQTEDYGNVMGVEFMMRRRAYEWLSGHITYTLQYARGTSSNVREAYYETIANIMPDPITGEPLEVPKIDFPLEFDQRHTININTDLFIPEGYGPSLGGAKPLENLNLNFLTEIGCGLPYTKEDNRGQRIGDVGGERLPWTFNTDLKLTKPFDLFGLNFSLFCRVTNLFNRKNILNVYPNTGKPDYNGFTQDFNTYVDQTWKPVFKDANEVEVGCQKSADGRRDLDNDGWITQDEWYESYVRAREDFENDPNMLNAPRRINIGVMINW